MNVLIIGNGGREHALAWAVSRSPQCKALFCLPGNGGTAQLGHNIPIPVANTQEIVEYALKHKIDLAIVGPEDPLASGLADQLRKAGVPTFGPSANAARIEASKDYAKQVMESAGVPHAQGESFTNAKLAHSHIENLNANNPPVIKADGLAAGKGVVVPQTIDQAHQAVDDLMHLSGKIVVEERLVGREVSAMAVATDNDIFPLPLACDWKRVGEQNTGANTGGMGVYAQPQFTENASTLVQHIHKPVLADLKKRNAPFQGILYAGLMVSENNLYVLEFNARFGDPETQAILPLLDGDVLELLNSVAHGSINKTAVTIKNQVAVGVVMASGGYPGAYKTGATITGLDEIDNDVFVFHAGTKQENNAVITTGGRVLCVVALAKDRKTAREIAYQNVDRIQFNNAYFRRDIALYESVATN